MIIRRFDDVQDFSERAMPFLLASEAEHNLIIGLCSNIALGASHYEEPPYFATLEADGQVIGAAMRTPPLRLILGDFPPEGLPLLADDVMHEFGSLPGVTGKTALSRAFADIWSERTGLGYHQKLGMRIFQLTAVRPPRDAPGSFRRAMASDRDLMIAWMTAFDEEALGEHNPERAAMMIDEQLQGGPQGMYVWEDEGAVVSMAGYTGPTPNGIRVIAVYTPPELRGRGYASSCVAALSQHLLEEKRKYVFLFTNLANPTPNHIYQEIGYEPVCDVTEFGFKEK